MRKEDCNSLISLKLYMPNFSVFKIARLAILFVIQKNRVWRIYFISWLQFLNRKMNKLRQSF